MGDALHDSLDVKESTQNRSTQTYQRLRECIVHGQLAPGSRIIESDLSERLDVSRTPVRSALQRLEQEGYVVAGNSGQRWRPRVAPLTREDAEELFYIIGELQGLAGWFAAGLESEAHADLVEDLQSCNERLRREAEGDSRTPEAYYELDWQFHRAYVSAGAGPRLLGLHDSIMPQAERYIRAYVSALTTEIETSIAEHDEIAQAIEERDPDGVQRAVAANWRGAAERLARVIDWVGERGSW